MSDVKVTFFVGEDFINSERVGEARTTIKPYVGEVVEIRSGDMEPHMLPVRAVKHVYTDGALELDVLLYDAEAAEKAHTDAWIAMMSDRPGYSPNYDNL